MSTPPKRPGSRESSGCRRSAPIAKRRSSLADGTPESKNKSGNREWLSPFCARTVSCKTMQAHGPAIRKQNAFYLPVDDGKVSLVDARDVASVAAILLTKDGHDGKTYDVTGPEALSNQEIAGILTRELGRTIRFLPVSENDAARAMTAAGLPDWLVNALLELYASQKVGEAEAIAPTVKQLTGRPAFFSTSSLRIIFRLFARERN